MINTQSKELTQFTIRLNKNNANGKGSQKTVLDKLGLLF
jgi:hypothetical protein